MEVRGVRLNRDEVAVERVLPLPEPANRLWLGGVSMITAGLTASLAYVPSQTHIDFVYPNQALHYLQFKYR
jgi:hypothetical protein